MAILARIDEGADLLALDVQKVGEAFLNQC
jgi:hypothetical protein